ncbi:MAG: efflux RND transporter periplasmic adaptor subunit [Acidobacteria bacterium]|nr:efflux RND transporter periplasmic adaptor subunit [Acidobacteriota bacterium]
MARSFLTRPSVWVALVVLIALGGLIAQRLREAQAAPEPAPTVEQLRETAGLPVSVVRAARGPFDVWRSFSGDVGGLREAIVRARTKDQVEAVLVTVGQRVALGQVLIRQTGETTTARVRQAEAARQQAQRNADRLRPLHEAGAISDQEWDVVATALELAEADLAASRDVLTLTSPLGGVVTEVPARPGIIPGDGEPLVRVTDLSRLLVTLKLTASQVAEVREGQVARLPGRTADGRVRRIALQADAASRLVDVEVEFPRESGLVPGTLATAEIRIAARPDTVVVPRVAVRDGAVWVVDGENRATRRWVQVGLEAGDLAEVLSGVSEGDVLVVEGGTLLGDGALVRIVNGTAAEAGTR